MRPKRSKTYHGVGITELLAAGVLSPGVQLVSTNGSWPAVAEVTPAGLRALHLLHAQIVAHPKIRGSCAGAEEPLIVLRIPGRGRSLPRSSRSTLLKEGIRCTPTPQAPR